MEADGQTRTLSGGEKSTTNNRMELTAAIMALTVVKNTEQFAGRKVFVNIDSQYVKNGITLWIKNWKARGWKTADKQPVKNSRFLRMRLSAKSVRILWRLDSM